MGIRTKPCVDCGKSIPAVRQKARCKECAKIRIKWMQQKYNLTRLGSPKLFQKLKSGKLIPADYGCGVNRRGKFPLKKSNWMNFSFNEDSEPSDKDLVERERIISEGDNQEECDWKRNMMYNWKHGIDEFEQPLSREDIYRAWKYWKENFK